jgi:hypothetical protein
MVYHENIDYQEEYSSRRVEHLRLREVSQILNMLILNEIISMEENSLQKLTVARVIMVLPIFYEI